MASVSGPQGSLVMLWAGEDPALHSALLEELQSAGIPFVDRAAGEERDGSATDPFFVGQDAKFGFKVAVPSTKLTEAEKILEELLGEEPVDMEIPAEDDAAPAAVETPVHLSKATSAVWTGTGEEQERAEFLSEALKENEIPVRTETHGNTTTLYVPPEEETLAREIFGRLRRASRRRETNF
ncbi:MAG: hypothetical protein WBE13_19040 [Candidatus Acidiferrum sp.]